MPAISVREALAKLDQLAGSDISVFGLLHFRFEDVAIYQIPDPGEWERTESAIWLYTGRGSLGFDERACKKLSGKTVLVQGTIGKPAPHLGGCGHMSAFPADLLARTREAHEC